MVTIAVCLTPLERKKWGEGRHEEESAKLYGLDAAHNPMPGWTSPSCMPCGRVTCPVGHGYYLA